MKASKIFMQTLPFSIAKLALGGIMFLASVLLLAILIGIGALIGGESLFVCIVIWMGMTGGGCAALMHYLGYLVKAGHIAVITEAATTGEVPAEQVKYGIEQVKKRFLTANVYFAVDRLVSGAVKQIQRGIQKLGNVLEFIPGMAQLTKLVNFFVELSLGYIDECCLGYTFYKKEQGAFKSACDGVVIYAQNIKHLLKNAAKTMLKVILLSIASVVVVFVLISGIFRLFEWNMFIAFFLSCFITGVLKFAFLDSYILCETMAGYMQVAPSTEITFNLYDKLCGISAKFKELFTKGQAESTPSGEAVSVGGMNS